MANLQAHLSGTYRSGRLRARSRHAGWFATLALIFAEALLAIVLVVAGIALFAQVRLALHTSVDPRAAGLLSDPRLAELSLPRPSALPDLSGDARPVRVPAMAPSTEPPPAPQTVTLERSDVAATVGTGSAVRLDVEIVGPPAAAQPVDTQLDPGAPPVAADRHDEPATVTAQPDRAPSQPSGDPAPIVRDVADLPAAAKPPAPPPPAAAIEGAHRASAVENPGRSLAPTASPPATAAAAAHHRVAKSKSRIRLAAKRQVRQARAPATIPAFAPIAAPAPTPPNPLSITPFYQTN